MKLTVIKIYSFCNTTYDIIFLAHAKRHHQAPSAQILAPSAGCRFLIRFQSCTQTLGALRGHLRPGEVNTTIKEYHQTEHLCHNSILNNNQSWPIGLFLQIAKNSASMNHKVVISRPIYYSIFHHWDATNQDVRLSEMCYYCHLNQPLST